MSFELEITFDFDAFEAEVSAAARAVFYELQQDRRDNRYLDLPCNDFKIFSRYHWLNFAIHVFPNDDSAHARRFA
jgi:hypothetical protein